MTDYDPTWRFTDEDFAAVGITREEWHDPVKRQEFMDSLQEEAQQTLVDEEDGIEVLVELAVSAINMYPDSRIDAIARFEGDAWRDLKQAMGDEAEVVVAQSDHYIHLMLLSTFKLAESRIATAEMMDGNRRVGK